jgi:hypothetical protein
MGLLGTAAGQDQWAVLLSVTARAILADRLASAEVFVFVQVATPGNRSIEDRASSHCRGHTLVVAIDTAAICASDRLYRVARRIDVRSDEVLGYHAPPGLETVEAVAVRSGLYALTARDASVGKSLWA